MRAVTLKTICLCIALLVVDAKAAEKIRVSLGVAGPDDIKGDIINCLGGELGQLRDVQIVTQNSDFQVRIIAVRLEAKKRGPAPGYAVSVLVTTQFRSEQAHRVFKHPVVAHFLEISPRGGLPDLCKRVALGIDSSVFGVERSSGESLR